MHACMSAQLLQMLALLATSRLLNYSTRCMSTEQFTTEQGCNKQSNELLAIQIQRYGVLRNKS